MDRMIGYNYRYSQVMIKIHCRSTNLDHRYALNKAVESYNEIYPNKNIDIFVGFREISRLIIRNLFNTLEKDTFHLFYFTGFGRLYTDYWLFGKFIFLILIVLCSIRKNSAFIVENPSDKIVIKRLSRKKTFLVNGSGFFEKIVDDAETSLVVKKNPTLKNILYLSRFGKSKHTDKVVSLARSLSKEFTLKIGGYDIGREKYSKIFNDIAQQRTNIDFLGKVTSRSQYYQLLQDADIFLYPSKREGCPFSVLESLAANTLPLVCNTPGSSDLAKQIGIPMVKPEDFSQVNIIENVYYQFFDSANSNRVYLKNISLYSAENIKNQFSSIFQSI